MTAVVKRVRDEALPVLVITISIGLYALFICNKTMPVSEGWYSEYAALINRGYVPYRDFDLIFPPSLRFHYRMVYQFFWLSDYMLTLFRRCGFRTYCDTSLWVFPNYL